LHAIKYFNSKGIVHRDLKPDNIIVMGYDTGDLADLRIKLIDFGMSKLINPTKKIDLSTYCGTIDFIAPEVFEGTGYDEKCDIWSIGVIAFFMVSGLPPFLGKDDVEVKSKIITCDYEFADEIWTEIPEDCKNFIEGLLELTPKNRFTPDSALD
jgi:serine/threonine protein kinase